MISKVEERVVKRSDNFSEKSFQIKTSNKAFKILSDGLYSDKITAIIRELSCNAYDAHVTANNMEKSFDIHLPNKLNPEFYIRDYGTGLSKEDIENIYTTYFESTKIDSNDVIGCLGLGSKSPFSYVDMYTITSFFNGEKYVYSAFLNEMGVPSISLIFEEETDEHNGLKVQFAVKDQDIKEFQYKAENVFKYFKLIPNFINNSSIQIKTVDYSFKNDKWGIRNSGYYDKGSRAIMGNVAYPINIKREDLDPLEKDIISNLSLDLFFSIGDLDISASREGLSYDQRTVDNIRKRINEIKAEERERIKNEIQTLPCYWDAVSWFLKEKINNPIVSYIYKRPYDVNEINYKGKEIHTTISLRNKNYDEYGIESIKMSHVKDRWNLNRGYSISRPYSIDAFSINYSTVIMLLDAPYYKKRMEKYLDDVHQEVNSLVLICLKNVKEKLSKEAINKICEDFQINESNIIKLSSFSYTPPKRIYKKKISQKNKFDNNDIYKFDEYYSEWKEDESFDFENGGFYVPLNRFKIIYNNEEKGNEFLYQTITLYNRILSDGENVVIYGIKKSKEKDFIENPNWFNFIDYCHKEMKKSNNRNKLIKALSYSKFFESCSQLTKYFSQLINNSKLTKEELDNSLKCKDIKKFIDIFYSSKDYAIKLPFHDGNSKHKIDYNFYDYCKQNQFLTKKQKQKVDDLNSSYSSLMSSIENKYVFLKENIISNVYYFDEIRLKNVLNDICDYINAMYTYNKRRNK